MKIIGVTVGSTTPKPCFDQTDPRKGDYIRGDRSFLNAVRTINGMSPDANGNVDVLSVLNIDYENTLGFDVTEIVIGGTVSTTSILGQAILGQMVLA